MKELLKQYAGYNVWANQKLITLILSLPEEKQQTKISGSFDSLCNTLLHLWDAESIWWQRMKMSERVIRPSENFNGSCNDIADGLLSQSMQWESWVKLANDRSLEHVFHYYNQKSEHLKLPVYQLLLHIFNHGTYHRGQLIMILHQLEISKLPSTDFTTYLRVRRA